MISRTWWNSQGLCPYLMKKTTPEYFMLFQRHIHLKSGKLTCFLNKIETFFCQLYYLHEFVCCTVVLKTEILCTKINWKFLCRNSQHRNEKQFCDMLFVRKRVIQISIGWVFASLYLEVQGGQEQFSQSKIPKYIFCILKYMLL